MGGKRFQVTYPGKLLTPEKNARERNGNLAEEALNRGIITPEVRLEVWAIAGDDNAWQMCVSCHCKLMLTAEECVLWNMAHSQDGPWATVLNFGHVWADGRTPKGPPVFGNGVKLCLREY